MVDEKRIKPAIVPSDGIIRTINKSVPNILQFCMSLYHKFINTRVTAGSSLADRTAKAAKCAGHMAYNAKNLTISRSDRE